MRLIVLLLLLVEFGFAKKVALVIGNSNYKHMEYLSSPKADARAMVTKLESLDFSVTHVYDLDEAHMLPAIKKFQRTISAGDIVFVYYSGHGGQVDKESYLIPTSVDTRDENAIRYHAVKVEEILRRLSNGGAKLNVLILDACRDAPTGTKGGYKGLGQIGYKPIGSLVLYSTSMNKPALDSRLFNQVVLDKLGSSNRYILNVANDISREVAKRTQNRQIPEVISQVVPDVILGSSQEEKHPMQGITLINGLMYQNQPFTSQDKSHYDNQTNGGRVWDWKGAKNYCSDLTLGNYRDWRLPNREELQVVGNIEFYHAYGDYKTGAEWKAQHQVKAQKHFDDNKHKRNSSSKGHKYFVKKAFVENMPPLTGKYKSATFWSSTERDSSYAWSVCFNFGTDDWYFKSNNGYALCVR
jgi:uncharacterized protein (TIGR02145 family)